VDESSAEKAINNNSPLANEIINKIIPTNKT
jgi:hypothetical protein